MKKESKVLRYKWKRIPTTVLPFLVACCVEMVDDCVGIGKEALNFFSILKQENPGHDDIASGANNLQLSIRALQEKTNVCIVYLHLH